ncbi:unnamed protein product [Caenorhabditis angaria]|uniref:MATH domain-containing protein n=1 Tax=Caenorhabditis angaria TaxID=860376 RepID=A0A9P1IHP3_9PELO|nr:unnamed protein product [Caenorhabditis angaria]
MAGRGMTSAGRLIENIYWIVGIRSQIIDGVNYLGCSLILETSRISKFVCEVSNVEFVTCNMDESKKKLRDFRRKFKKLALYTEKNTIKWGIEKFIEWSKLEDYIYADLLKMGVDFDFKLYNFDEDVENSRDFQIMLNNGKIFGNEKLLADVLESPNFEKLENIESKQFAIFYAAIHPDPISITDVTFATLLDMAKILELESLFEKWIILGFNSENVNVMEKFKIAEKYEENRFLKMCLDSIKSSETAKEFLRNPEYKNLKEKIISFFTFFFKNCEMNPIISQGNSHKSTFTNITNLSNELTHGDDFVTDNLTWKLSIRSSIIENIKYFACYLELSKIPPNSNFVCEVRANFAIWKNDRILEKATFRSPVVYTKKWKSWGFLDFIEHKKLRTPKEKEFIENVEDSVEICVKFDYKFYKFDKDLENLRDFRVKLKADDILYVNKQFLSMFSKQLLEEFKNSSVSFNLEDVEAHEFALLYASIHPDPIEITDKNFSILLDLSNRFEIEVLFKKCMKEGLESKYIPFIEKLKGADKIEPKTENELLKNCMEKFKNQEQFKKFFETPEFENLKKTTQLKFLKALVEIL